MNNTENVDLFDLLADTIKQMRRTWIIGLLVLLVTGAIGYEVGEYTYTPLYKATTTFTIKSDEANLSVSSSAYYNSLSASQMSSTFPYILKSGALEQIVCEDLSLTSLPASISARQLGTTNILEISVTGYQAQLVYDILQSVIRNYNSVSGYIIGNLEMSLLNESGIPTKPVNSKQSVSKAKKYAAAGFLAYAIFSMIIALSIKTVRTKKDITHQMNIVCLGMLPYVKKKKRTGNSSRHLALNQERIPFEYREAVEHCQEYLTKKMDDNQWKTLLVTSTLPNEGKTTVACNLAILLRKKGHSVAMLDGDLRNPSVADVLQIDEEYYTNRTGLADYLEGKISMDDILKYQNEDGMLVIPGGEYRDNVAELLNSDRFVNLLNEMREKYDYVIIDTPPCTYMHDASLILPFVDTSLMVIRQDYAPVSKIRTCADVLSQEGKTIAGAIINVDTLSGKSDGYYGYGHYSKYNKYSKYGKYRKYENA